MTYTHFYSVIERCCVFNCLLECRRPICVQHCVYVRSSICLPGSQSISRYNPFLYIYFLSLSLYPNVSLISINIRVRSHSLWARVSSFRFGGVISIFPFLCIFMFAYTRDVCIRSARQCSTPYASVAVVIALFSSYYVTFVVVICQRHIQCFCSNSDCGLNRFLFWTRCESI